MTTPLAALVAALRGAGDYDPRVEVAPEVVLWCATRTGSSRH